MGRPREFDLETVLDAAQAAFWDHGYEGTSIHDLLEATGLQRGSLYKAFGDKRGLYLRTLERYQHLAREEIARRIASPKGALAGLGKWLRTSAEGCGASGPQGCFVVNSTIELCPHDEEVAALAKDHAGQLQALVEEVVVRAQAAGELRTDLAPDEIAHHLILVATGLAVDSRGGAPVRRRRQQAELALKLMLPA